MGIDHELIALNQKLTHYCKFGKIDEVKKLIASKEAYRLDWNGAFMMICQRIVSKQEKLIALFLAEVKELNFEIIFRELVIKNDVTMLAKLQDKIPKQQFYLDELLVLSCRYRHINTLMYLIESFTFEIKTLNEAFIQACKQGCLDIASFLLEKHNVDIHYLDDYGLRQAGNHQHLELIQYLLTSPTLKETANPYAMDDDLSIGLIMRNDKTIYRYLYEEYGLKETQRVKEYREFKMFSLNN